MNKQVRGAMKAGIKDAALSHKTTRNDSPAKPPQTNGTGDYMDGNLPFMGFIHAGTLIESPLQVTHSIAYYWARRVWDKRVKDGLEVGVMPDNWIGLYVVGSLIHEVVTHPVP